MIKGVQEVLQPIYKINSKNYPHWEIQDKGQLHQSEKEKKKSLNFRLKPELGSNFNKI